MFSAGHVAVVSRVVLAGARPPHAVSYLRERAKTEIKSFLRAASPGEQPILPRLEDLLIEAAGHGHVTAATIDPDYVEAFRGKLAGLRPADFTPQGSGACVDGGALSSSDTTQPRSQVGVHRQRGRYGYAGTRFTQECATLLFMKYPG